MDRFVFNEQNIDDMDNEEGVGDIGDIDEYIKGLGESDFGSVVRLHDNKNKTVVGQAMLDHAFEMEHDGDETEMDIGSGIDSDANDEEEEDSEESTDFGYLARVRAAAIAPVIAPPVNSVIDLTFIDLTCDSQ